jgi:anti-anti-sigma regulatory factor
MTTAYLQLEVEQCGPVKIASFRGRQLGTIGVLGKETAAQLWEDFQRLAMQAASAVLLDLARVEILGQDAWLMPILRFYKTLKERGIRLAVCCPNPGLKAVFDALRLNSLFPVTSSRADAIEALGKKA